MRFPLAAALAARLLFPAAGASAAIVPEGQLSPALYAAPGRLMPVDGDRKLNLLCVGAGKTTVVFLSGLGNSNVTWAYVQGQIGLFARSCSYDRAGLGFSDPSPHPANAGWVAWDLQRLLAGARIGSPIVLVGHSIGGLYATLYASRHKKQVAGMVLVDPSFAHQYQEFTRTFGPAARRKFHQGSVSQRKFFTQCLGIAQSGAFTLPATAGSAADQLCLDVSPPAPGLETLWAARNAQATSPSLWRAVLSEADAFRDEIDGAPNANDRLLDAANLAFGSMPITVLTAGPASFKESCAQLALRPGQCAAFIQAWRWGHARLAENSSRGRTILVTSSGHAIQEDQPAAVIDAVRAVVSAAETQ